MNGGVPVLVACAVILSGGLADGQTLPTASGPLEQRARPISPANPIPKRVFVVMPARPSDVELVDTRAVVTLRVTIDESGSVAEVRSPCCGLLVRGRSLEANDALIAAAVDAVKQWRYEPPAEGPMAFDVTVAFRADGTTRLAADQAASGRLIDTGPADVSLQPQIASSRPPIKTKHVPPTYPPEALAAGISGVVVIEVRIETDGHIRTARVVRSVPGLDEAALAAVLQWEYEIPVVNGAATPILTSITIEFAPA